MGAENFEKFDIEDNKIELTEQTIKETKAALDKLQIDIDKDTNNDENFFDIEKNGNKVVNMDRIKAYLEGIKEIPWQSKIGHENLRATIKAVQITLMKIEKENTTNYYDWKITGEWTSEFQKAVKTFQEENNLKWDGIPGPNTITKILETINKKDKTLDETKNKTLDETKNKSISYDIFKKVVSWEMDMPESDWEDIKNIPKNELIKRAREKKLVRKIWSEDQSDLNRRLNWWHYVEKSYIKISDLWPKFVRWNYKDLEDFLQQESVSN